MMAAEMPMAKVSSPARHHGAGDQRLRTEPMEKKVSPVMTVEASIDVRLASEAPATVRHTQGRGSMEFLKKRMQEPDPRFLDGIQDN
jgi:hypothetical protein